MSAILFSTLPKEDLPHYFYIFRKMEPFGTDVKDSACSRFGKILHLDIKKWVGGYKDVNFSKIFLRECSVHEEINVVQKRVWPTDIKWHLLCRYLVQCMGGNYPF